MAGPLSLEEAFDLVMEAGLAVERRVAARAFGRVVLHDALEKARNSVPSEWRVTLDYIERIDAEAIMALDHD